MADEHVYPYRDPVQAGRSFWLRFARYVPRAWRKGIAAMPVASSQTAKPRPSGAAPTRTSCGARSLSRVRNSTVVLPNQDELRGPVRAYSTHVQEVALLVSAITCRRPRASWTAVEEPKMLRSAPAAREARQRSRRVSSERNLNGGSNPAVRCSPSGSCSNRKVPRGPLRTSALKIPRSVPRAVQAFGS